MKKEISTSTYSFEDLRKSNCLYVDKTKYLYQMIKVSRGQFFCARPRRFGKSLMVSTLEALFQGKRDLFKDLYIADGKDVDGSPIVYDWQEYPIIHLNLAGCNATTPERLEAWLKNTIQKEAKKNHIELADNYAEIMFENLIDALASEYNQKVVILLDEYDKPLTDNIDNKRIEEIRNELEGFYGVIKAEEENLRFTFITGVTKFSQVSIFSKLNNLTDISLSKDAACMFGYTQKELEDYFKDYIDDALDQGIKNKYGEDLTKEQFLGEIKTWYDGFRFYPTEESVYNPVSIGNFFNFHCDFSYYWYSTGTSSWLEGIARKQPVTIRDIEELPIPKSAFAEFNIEDFAIDNFDKVDLMKLLYQTGYLTLQEDKKFLEGPDNPYRLQFPNREVKEAFMRLLINAYSGNKQMANLIEIRQAVEQGDTKEMIAQMRYYFASIRYPVNFKGDREEFYQYMTYAMFFWVGEDMKLEEATNIGRIDAVLNADGHLYIIEFKLNKSADEAAGQIADRKYVEKYMIPAKREGKDIRALGINFSTADAMRNIDSYREKVWDYKNEEWVDALL
ncbi:MAG: AAA family ATPase [Oribacterium sp.]|nr:AAA family ATPase [Oribacterium sp.]